MFRDSCKRCPLTSSSPFADVLIVGGQGAYKDGEYFAEFPDRDVYLGHAIAVREVAERYRYSCIVCSGGLTQKLIPTLSEAASFENMWGDTNSRPTQPVYLDEFSLDSAENVYIGLMVARISLGDRCVIRRIGVFSAWDFKKARFNRVAEKLGIINRFYFHGFAPASRANAGDRLLRGENAFLEQITTDDDDLVLGRERHLKRKQRYSGTNFSERLKTVKDRFPDVFAALAELADNPRDQAAVTTLQKAFRHFVIME
jgi:hypothetical protein